MKYFISFKAQSKCGAMITGNGEIILDAVIDIDTISEIENNIMEENNYEIVVITNFIKFEENV